MATVDFCGRLERRWSAIFVRRGGKLLDHMSYGEYRRIYTHTTFIERQIYRDT